MAPQERRSKPPKNKKAASGCGLCSGMKTQMAARQPSVFLVPVVLVVVVMVATATAREGTAAPSNIAVI
jgi:hypothetical protein